MFPEYSVTYVPGCSHSYSQVELDADDARVSCVVVVILRDSNSGPHGVLQFTDIDD
jgi:hypothetical protein